MTDTAQSTELNRCRDRWGDVRNAFLSKTTKEPETRAIERHEMWESMCQQHKGSKLVTTEGVWYYKTKRFTEKRNTIYILWRGESIVIIMRALAELTFIYDHLPGAKFVLLTGQLDKEHVLPWYAGGPKIEWPPVTQGSNP